MDLEVVIDEIIQSHNNSASRLDPLADYIRGQLELYGLPNVLGGTGGELRIGGMARQKKWDIAYEFFGKPRLLISLKSLWKNASGTVPNRIDEVIGETANVQQLTPEIVTGYVLLFDIVADSQRQGDGKKWSEFFEESIKKLTIRKAPIWNQGLLEGTWFLHIDSRKPKGQRILYPEKAAVELERFITELLAELTLREPAIELRSTK
jgi:hypothetical protein